MPNTIYDRIHRSLSWRKIIAFNALLFLVTVIPLSVRLAQEDTENRSGAAGEVPTPSITPPPSYPAESPRIDRVVEFFGKRGDTIVILGSNFGDYQWGSTLYVGDVATGEADVVRWTTSVIEVQIPEAARTGRVWIAVNGREAQWEGSLLLYDVSRSAQTGIRKENATQASVWFSNAAGTVRGMVEVGHASEPLFMDSPIGSILQTSRLSDSLGKKTKVEFVLNTPLTGNVTTTLSILYPGIGSLEILRVELYDESGRLVPVYADPLSVKVQ